MSKVTLVGASSVLWSPKILGDFYVTPEKPIEEICLNGRDPARLAPIAALAALMEKKTGRRFRVTIETDFDKAVRGSDFVVVAIAVGGLKAMEQDLLIPERYGILPTVGDTVGPSGYSRLLRNVPVFLDMARRMEKAAPNAWFLNVSNPLTPLVELVSRNNSLRVAGMCSGIVNHVWILQELFGFKDLSEVEFRVGGIDHCSWFLDIRVRGRDIYPDLRKLSIAELEDRASLMRSKDEWAKLDSLTASFDLFKNLGYLPAISDRHLSEFFPFFLSSSEYLRRWNIKRTRISDRTAWAENARKNLNAILSGEKELTLSKSRDIVVDIINALAGAGETTTTINYPNGGQIENLPRGAVVETVARFNSRGITPLPVGALPAPLMPIVLPHILRQRVALQAALEGSRELFAAALLTDPTVRDLASVPDMARELIAAQKDLLPQFSRV